MFGIEDNVLSKSPGNLVRVLIFIKSMSCLKLGHVVSKARSLGQILDKPCVRCRGHSFEQKTMKLCQNVNFHKIYMYVKFETGSCWIKN